MKLRSASLLSSLALMPFACVAFGAPPAGAGNPVQALSDQLAALTARVAKLEGQITAADLVGTYAVHGFQTELRAAGGGAPTQVASYIYVGTAALTADNSTTLTLTEEGSRLLFTAPPSVVPDGPIAGSLSGTWTYANGVVTASEGGSPIPLNVAVGGRVLIGASANHSDGTNVLLIFTRLQ
jgi:hypothetical protein